MALLGHVGVLRPRGNAHASHPGARDTRLPLHLDLVRARRDRVGDGDDAVRHRATRDQATAALDTAWPRESVADDHPHGDRRADRRLRRAAADQRPGRRLLLRLEVDRHARG